MYIYLLKAQKNPSVLLWQVVFARIDLTSFLWLPVQQNDWHSVTYMVFPS